MSLEHSPEREGVKKGETRQVDPILSFNQVCTELNVSIWTFNREIRPYIPIVQVSPGRKGVRTSVVEGLKEARTIPAARSEQAAQK